MASMMHEESIRQERDDGRSLGALFSDLWRQTATLFRAETQLASTELGEKVSKVESAFMSIGIGVAILAAALIILLWAGVAGLALVLPVQYAAWLSPLIVGAAAAVVGIAVLLAGRSSLSAANLKPQRTVRTLRDDAELGREHLQ